MVLRKVLLLPNALIGRERLWARVVLGTLANGNIQVLSIPLTREFTIPLDWSPP